MLDFNLSARLSLIDFIQFFSTQQICLDYIQYIRFPFGVACPFCGSLRVTKFRADARNQRFKCNEGECRNSFSMKVGTIFQGNKIPLNKLFPIIYANFLNKKNTSSLQVAKNFGITQTTSWKLMNKLRPIFYQNDIILSGIVEIDEAFVSKSKLGFGGGQLSNRKAPVLGLIERGGRVVIKKIPDRSESVIEQIVTRFVRKGTTIYTDGHLGYRNLNRFYEHHWVNHSDFEFARGEVSTNSIENVWTLMKKSMRAAHHNISDKYLQFYLDEFAYKFNNRHLKPMEVFNDVLRRACYVPENNLQSQSEYFKKVS